MAIFSKKTQKQQMKNENSEREVAISHPPLPLPLPPPSSHLAKRRSKSPSIISKLHFKAIKQFVLFFKVLIIFLYFYYLLSFIFLHANVHLHFTKPTFHRTVSTLIYNNNILEIYGIL